MDTLPARLLEIVNSMKGLYEKLEPRTPAWCKSLVSTGSGPALLSFDSSARAQLGEPVERQLRALSIVTLYSGTDNVQPDWMVKPKWEGRADLNSGVVALLDILAVSTEPDLKLNLPQVEAVRDSLNQKVKTAAEDCASLIARAKSSLVPVFEPLNRVVRIAEQDGNAWLANAEVKTIAQRFNKEESDSLKKRL